MAELLCLEQDVDFQDRPEGEGPMRSYRDPTIFDDASVLENLLRSEERYAINPRYFTCVQTEIAVNMRRTVGQWMLEVCEEEQCRAEVYPLAMNCLDRFLSVQSVRKSQLQLTGAACMLLASKFRQTKPLTLERLCMYTAYSVNKDDLRDWELLVVSKLRWDLSGVIANDFLDQLIHRIELPGESRGQRDLIRSHSQTFITLCATEFEFSLSPASMVAAASISTAVAGLVRLSWSQKRELLQRLHEITSIEVDCLQDCQHRIEQMLARNCPEIARSSSSVNTSAAPPASGDYSTKVANEAAGLETETPDTPTDVQDVLF
ncbi:G1/S-specific cyclin-D3 [Ixodes scapularis]|nr:G1/S-specific cyclin-D3 [Ixodes scapularis]